MRDIEHEDRNGDVAIKIRQTRRFEATVEGIEKATLNNDADITLLRPPDLVQPILDDEFLRGR